MAPLNTKIELNTSTNVLEITQTVGSGESNIGANVGAGSEVFRDKTGITLNFRKLNGTTVSVTQNADDISLASNASLEDARQIGNTLSGSIDMGSNVIEGVADPVSGTDAANKDSVDNQVIDCVEDEFTPTAGQTVFSLSDTPNDADCTEFLVNGVNYDDGVDFTVSGTTATWLDNEFVLDTTDKVLIRYNTTPGLGPPPPAPAAGDASETTGNITITIDYNDGSAADPTSTDIFHNQTEADAFLTANSATTFKHLQLFWEALPNVIKHDIVINLAGGVHRPVASGTQNTPYAWNLTGKVVTEKGSIKVLGAPVGSWPVVAGLTGITILSHNTGATGNPFILVAGAALGGTDIRGSFGRMSTGQTVTVHDYASGGFDTINPLEFLSPAPTNTVDTIDIVTQATILRNSLDDSTTEYSGFLKSRVPLCLEDIKFEKFGSGDGHLIVGGRQELRRCTMDELTTTQAPFSVPATGWGWSVGSREETSAATEVIFEGCSFIAATPASTGPDFILLGQLNGTCRLKAFVGLGSKRGIECVDGFGFRSWGAVFDEIYDPSGTDPGAIRFRSGAKFEFLDVAQVALGKQNEIRDVPATAGIYIEEASLLRFAEQGLLPNHVRLRGFVNPCVRIGPKTSIVGLGATSLFVDGGSNADVGIEVIPSHSVIQLPSGNNVTGLAGNMRIEGVITSYGTLGTSTAPTITTNLSAVSRS